MHTSEMPTIYVSNTQYLNIYFLNSTHQHITLFICDLLIIILHGVDNILLLPCYLFHIIFIGSLPLVESLGTSRIMMPHQTKFIPFYFLRLMGARFWLLDVPSRATATCAVVSALSVHMELEASCGKICICSLQTLQGATHISTGLQGSTSGSSHRQSPHGPCCLPACTLVAPVLLIAGFVNTRVLISS